MLIRGLVYETLVFCYAFILALLFFGDPRKGLLMTVIITIGKYPLYWAFHHFWRERKP